MNAEEELARRRQLDAERTRRYQAAHPDRVKATKERTARIAIAALNVLTGMYPEEHAALIAAERPRGGNYHRRARQRLRDAHPVEYAAARRAAIAAGDAS